ncbi:hypothetical protein F3Y22_tig00116925pilonHSYRG00037 [Hibiscus syriacus]|uniref:CCHC-type domain-containing protein n=1 Tax=Hibiscus syriacus TaxID=106335 RepID=A0A6A2WM77_HIBSY|nr:hypothetical protein F3Y22_tig00116925pilonHSYRG00037 [Hibiscus syriacus]
MVKIITHFQEIRSAIERSNDGHHYIDVKVIAEVDDVFKGLGSTGKVIKHKLEAASSIVSIVNPRLPKKQRRRDEDSLDPSTMARDGVVSLMECDDSTHVVSYKDVVMKSTTGQPDSKTVDLEDDDIELLEEDNTLGSSNGIPTINFSKRVQSLTVKSMDLMLVVKVLGRRFSDHGDYLKVLTEGPWTIFGHYLIVEPWSIDFQPNQDYPSRLMAWIRLSGLPVTLYKRRGFARLAVSLNLHRPLVSKILINGRLQIIEYESFPTVCFHCGIYGHHKDLCPQLPTQGDVQPMTEIPPPQPQTTENSVSDEAFGPWLLVERKKLVPNNLKNRSKSRVIEAESTVPLLVSPSNPEISSLTEPKSILPDKHKAKDKAPTNSNKAPTVPYAPKKQTHLGGCGHRNFNRVARQYLRDHSPDVVGFIETLISSHAADKAIAQLKIPKSFRVEADGFSGGIWICWYDHIQIDVLFSHFQFVHCRIHCNSNNRSTLATFVYASLNPDKRRTLWKYLHLLSNHINEPWVVLGNFNVALSPNDRKSCVNNPSSDDDFSNIVFYSSLHDLGYQGPYFAWFNLTEALAMILNHNVEFDKEIQSLLTFLFLPWKGLDIRSLSKVWNRFYSFLSWSISDGTTTIFWHDNWLPKLGCLSEWKQEHITVEYNMLVRDVALSNGNWNWNLLQQFLQPSTIQNLLNVQPPNLNAGTDRCCWSQGKHGEFTVKSAYELLTKDLWDPKDIKWTTLWRMTISERIKYFLWLSYKDCLLTNVNRCARKLTGLQLALSHNIERLQCQTDNIEALNLVSSLMAKCSPIALVRSIAKLISKQWTIKFILIRCEANAASNFLAKSTVISNEQSQTYTEPPHEIKSLLHRDLYVPAFLRT